MKNINNNENSYQNDVLSDFAHFLQIPLPSRSSKRLAYIMM